MKTLHSEMSDLKYERERPASLLIGLVVLLAFRISICEFQHFPVPQFHLQMEEKLHLFRELG